MHFHNKEVQLLHRLHTHEYIINDYQINEKINHHNKIN